MSLLGKASPSSLYLPRRVRHYLRASSTKASPVKPPADVRERRRPNSLGHSPTGSHCAMLSRACRLQHVGQSDAGS